MAAQLIADHQRLMGPVVRSRGRSHREAPGRRADAHVPGARGGGARRAGAGRADRRAACGSGRACTWARRSSPVTTCWATWSTWPPGSPRWRRAARSWHRSTCARPWSPMAGVQFGPGPPDASSRASNRCRWSGCCRPHERCGRRDSGRSGDHRDPAPRVRARRLAALRRHARRGGRRREARGLLRRPARAGGLGAVRRCGGAAAPGRAAPRWCSTAGRRRWPRTTPRPGVAAAIGGCRAVRSSAARIMRTRSSCAWAQGVQTNEVGRSAALFGGYLELARLGSSAAGPRGRRERRAQPRCSIGTATGWASTGLRPGRTARSCSIGRGSSDDADLTIPLRSCSSDGAATSRPSGATPRPVGLRLRSFVWGDQLDRLARLDAALAVAVADPPVVDRARAAAWLGSEQLAEPGPGHGTVVTHSIIFQYLSGPGARRDAAAIDAAGRRSHPGCPRSPGCGSSPGGDQAELRLTTWPGGDHRVLATSVLSRPPGGLAAPARRRRRR